MTLLNGFDLLSRYRQSENDAAEARVNLGRAQGALTNAVQVGASEHDQASARAAVRKASDRLSDAEMTLSAFDKKAIETTGKGAKAAAADLEKATSAAVAELKTAETEIFTALNAVQKGIERARKAFRQLHHTADIRGLNAACFQNHGNWLSEFVSKGRCETVPALDDYHRRNQAELDSIVVEIKNQLAADLKEIDG